MAAPEAGKTVGVGDRAQARRAVRDHHAGQPPALALGAHGGVQDDRLAADEQRRDHLEQLTAVDRAIRNHDPCISCSAHFLTLTVERG